MNEIFCITKWRHRHQFNSTTKDLNQLIHPSTSLPTSVSLPISSLSSLPSNRSGYRSDNPKTDSKKDQELNSPLPLSVTLSDLKASIANELVDHKLTDKKRTGNQQEER